jgi:hypothetical protein
LLGKDGLLIKLIIQRVGKEVTARGEVGRPGDGAVADDCVLGWRSRGERQARRRDGDRAGAVGCDGHRVVGGQRQERVILEDRDVSVRQDFKRKRIRPSATRSRWRVNRSARDVANWNCHIQSLLLLIVHF